ncbi:DUF4286 family protein [Roseitranquillus sediminis]|uniref:DUF4286 family protein n=1 Tax=Roseitranquillus sediminis TaxID=2809051 RepID=UPI001D0CA740|nr:DUF4286 family protein [Roseitranquillus sediminis]MBM9594453.1 hypothetical protein [Roseitranquillus sediminis]
MKQKAVLFSEMTPEPEWEDEFNAWYDEEHVPLRMKVPGFAGAQRYRRNERDYCVVYDLDETAVLQTAAYREVKDEPSERTAWMLRSVSNFTRYIGRPVGARYRAGFDGAVTAPVLYPVFFDVPEDRVEEFDHWYEEDHVPTLMECEEWLACRRFALEVADPGQFNRLALHYLASPLALESNARAKARASEWRARLAQEPWFKGSYMVFERHGPRSVAQ